MVGGGGHIIDAYAVSAGRVAAGVRRHRPRSEAALVRAAQRGSEDALAELFWLLATWPSRRRWLVLGAGGETLDATPTPRGAPGRITGWCC